jgi:hypothetical protein
MSHALKMEGVLLLIAYYRSGLRWAFYVPSNCLLFPLSVHFDFPGIILADYYTITSAFIDQRTTGVWRMLLHEGDIRL